MRHLIGLALLGSLLALGSCSKPDDAAPAPAIEEIDRTPVAPSPPRSRRTERTPDPVIEEPGVTLPVSPVEENRPE